MAKKKQPYQQLVSDEVAYEIPGDTNGWKIGFYDSYRIRHGGNGTLASYLKGSESLELGRSKSDYYVLHVTDIEEKSIGWSSDISAMIQLLIYALNAETV